MSGFPWHFGALQFTLLWRSSENTLLPHWFLIPFRLSTIFTVWNVKNLEKLFVLCWQIYFSGFLSALFQQFTSFHQKLTFKAITYFSFPTFFLFSTNIILSRFHVFLVCSLLYVAQMLLLSEEPYRDCAKQVLWRMRLVVQGQILTSQLRLTEISQHPAKPLTYKQNPRSLAKLPRRFEANHRCISNYSPFHPKPKDSWTDSWHWELAYFAA